MNKIGLGIALLSAGIIVGTSSTLAVQVSFQDVRTEDWFYGDVESMVNMGVIKGYSDNTYRPANSVNRAEVAAMLNRYNTYIRTQCYTKQEIHSLFQQAGITLPEIESTGGENTNTNTDQGENTSQEDNTTTPSESETVYDVLGQTPEVSLFYQAINSHPDLVAELQNNDKKFTIIAPTNSSAGLENVIGNKNSLAMHLSTYWASESDIIIMYDPTEFTTLAGNSLTLQKNEQEQYTINGKVLEFVEPTHFGSNGTILVFNGVIE